jgi:hypothetical protein
MGQAKADIFLEFGNENVLGTGTYPSDPKAGATLQGLAPNVVTDATLSLGHGFPFSPGPGDFPGTDQIYVGSNQTGNHDGYSGFSGRLPGPQVVTLNYSSLVSAGQLVTTLTLGIASDDFQFTVFGQPFTASVNGTTDTALTNKLNSPLNKRVPDEIVGTLWETRDFAVVGFHLKCTCPVDLTPPAPSSATTLACSRYFCFA